MPCENTSLNRDPVYRHLDPSIMTWAGISQCRFRPRRPPQHRRYRLWSHETDEKVRWRFIPFDEFYRRVSD